MIPETFIGEDKNLETLYTIHGDKVKLYNKYKECKKY